MTWAEHATRAHEAFTSRFWNEDTGLFLDRFPFEPREGPFNYWWQAHALDTLVDAFERDGQAAHLERATRLLEGIRARNGSRITNDYFDDMEWLALACLRAFDASDNPAFKDATLALWADIQTGWNDACGGGIAWRRPQLDYKNTPANAPAAILAARLYRRFGHPADLEMARRIWGWLEGHLIDPQTGFVWDGMNREGNVQVDTGWAFTYNQGVVIGAALELHGVAESSGVFESSGQGFLENARRTAHAARSRFAAPETLAMPDENGGDGGLFKGILARYLCAYALASRDADTMAWLEANARLAVTAGFDPATNLFGRAWTSPPAYPLDLSTALSGVMLLEAMARLERAGMVE